MKGIKNQIALLIIGMGLFFSTGTITYAQTSEYEPLAEYLNKMGLFNGTGTSFELDKTANRAQSAAMVVRLMGKEAEAMANNYTHPFKDVADWADPYVGYLWTKGITKGLDDDEYGSSRLISAKEYMSFLLRVLGYSDAQGDFVWYNSLSKANNIGILSYSDYKSYEANTEFYRNDMVLFSYEVLGADLKSERGTSLLKSLKDKTVLPEDALLEYIYAPYISTQRNYAPKSNDELVISIVQGILAFDSSLTIDISGVPRADVPSAVDRAMEISNKLPGFYANAELMEYRYSILQAKIDITYMVSKYEHEKAVSKAKTVINEIIDNSMSDFQRELAIHDYIVDNTEYYFLEPYCYDMSGVFLKNKAVCGGYAEAFSYLSALAGIETEIVLGDDFDSLDDLGHAWNTVKIGGDWYQMDVTWNDPVMKDGSNVKTYSYFNVTDAEMKKDHIWDDSIYNRATVDTYNYYVYNNLTVNGAAELEQALRGSAKKRPSRIAYKNIGSTISDNTIDTILGNLSSIEECQYFYDTKTGVLELFSITYR